MTEPSLRFTTVRFFGEMPTSQTEYICGRNTRSENRSCRGHSDTTPPSNMRYEYGPLRAYIYNRDLSYRFDLDLATRIYTAYRANEYGSPMWIKPRQRQAPKSSGRTLHIHTETIDTGERREMFGYTARRVITQGRETRDSELLRESECDGWYIDPPQAWLNLHPPPKPGTIHHAVLRAGNAERDDYKFTETGERETGFLLLAKRTEKLYFRDEKGNSRVDESNGREEIIECSEGPLDRELFVPPRDFKRVSRLPDEMRYGLAHRARLRWEILKDWLRLQHRIVKFTG